LINKLRACNNNSKWCSNNSWCNKCTRSTQWCQMLTFNSSKWCSLLKCSNNLILTLKSNNRPFNNKISWICQHKPLKCHRTSCSHKCSSKTNKCHQTSSKPKHLAVQLRHLHQSSKTFCHHQWWNYPRLTKLQLQIKPNQNNQH